MKTEKDMYITRHYFNANYEDRIYFTIPAGCELEHIDTDEEGRKVVEVSNPDGKILCNVNGYLDWQTTDEINEDETLGHYFYEDDFQEVKPRLRRRTKFEMNLSRMTVDEVIAEFKMLL